jgi:hypothetical protein
MTILGTALFGCLATGTWFALPRKSEAVDKGLGKITPAPLPTAPGSSDPSAKQTEIRPEAIAALRTLRPSREEVLVKAIEIEYALHRLRACLGGEVRVLMDRNGLRIAEEPGSPDRERELQTALGTVSMPAWVTRESEDPGRTRVESKAVTAEVRAVESGTAAAPAAEDAVRTYLRTHPDAAGPGDPASMAANYSSRVLSNASAAMREAWALRRLAETYPAEGIPSHSRWLLETMLRDHMRELSGDVGRSADLIAPVFALSKTQAPQSAETGSWQQETERVFKGVEDFERRASALFGDATEPTVRADTAPSSAAALITGASEILRGTEFLDRMITSAFSSANGRARGDGVRN